MTRRTGSVPDALERIGTVARHDLADRRAGDRDDVAGVLETRLEALRRAPRSLVLQLGVEVQRPRPWWSRFGLGLDQYLDRTPFEPVRSLAGRTGAGAAVDDLVFGTVYTAGACGPRDAAPSLRDVRSAFGVTTAFATAPGTLFCWRSRVRIVQVTSALEPLRIAHVVAEQIAAEAAGESGYSAADGWHSRHAQSQFLTRSLGRWMVAPRSVPALAAGLVQRIPWLDDVDRTEERLRTTLAVDVARPGVSR